MKIACATTLADLCARGCAGRSEALAYGKNLTFWSRLHYPDAV